MQAAGQGEAADLDLRFDFGRGGLLQQLGVAYAGRCGHVEVRGEVEPASLRLPLKFGRRGVGTIGGFYGGGLAVKQALQAGLPLAAVGRERESACELAHKALPRCGGGVVLQGCLG